jgi:hypothetical protein
MARNDPRQPDEGRLLRKLRIVCGVTMLALLAFLIIVDAIGRLFVDPGFHIDDIMVGSLLGALLLVLGVSGVVGFRLPGGWEVRKDEKPDGSTDEKP